MYIFLGQVSQSRPAYPCVLGAVIPEVVDLVDVHSEFVLGNPKIFQLWNVTVAESCQEKS